MVEGVPNSRRETLFFYILIDCIARFGAIVSLHSLHASFETHDLHLVVYELFVHHGGVQRTDDASWCVVFDKSVFGSWCFHLIHLTTSLLGSSCGLKFLVIMFFPLHLILFLKPFMAFIKTFKTESGVELLGSLKF